MSSKTLTASVRLNTTSAERSIDRLSKKFNQINNAINKSATASTRMGSSLSRSCRQSGSAVDGLTKKLGKLAKAYLGVMGARAAITTSDTITKAQNKFNYMNGGDTKATQETMDKIYVTAQKVRSSYTDMMSNVSKSMVLAGDAFQGNIDNAIKFQEIMSQAYTLGGASLAEQSSSMYQMIQALGSGTLQGDELRSVREGAPLAYKAIEEFAQGVYKTDESLKQLASDGKISSDIVVAAIMDMANGSKSLDKAFNETSMTFEQAWNNIKNTAIKAFEPVLQMLNNLLNSEVGQGIINGIGYAIQIVAGILMWLFNLISTVYNFIVENWSVISKIILTIASIIAIALIPKMIAWVTYLIWTIYYYGVLAGAAIASAIKVAIAWMIANWQMALIILVIAAIVVALIWLSDSFEDACGIIVGVIMAAISVVWNLFVMLVTLIIQGVVMPITTAWDTFANFFGNLFNDPIASIIYAFEGLAQAVLGILKTIANGIDAIFGSNLSSAVNGWSKGLSGKADSLAKKYGNGSYKEKSNQTEKLNNLLSDIQTNFSWKTSDAYNTGYEWGKAGGTWIKDKVGGIGDSLSKSLNLGNLPTSADYNLNGSYDPSKALNGVGSPNDDLKKIKGNTGKIADSMDLTTEDLAYLRKVAEMEWKKEFTTAEIKIDMNNNNTINGESDLDGIVTKLTDKLYEELASVADGAYA